MKTKTTDYLEQHSSETPSRWREEAEFRRENAAWLRYSQEIALSVLQSMKQQNITQTVLASRMDCTQQYVSKILKGKENLSLEIISKLELALGISILNINTSSALSVAADEAAEYGIKH